MLISKLDIASFNSKVEKQHKKLSKMLNALQDLDEKDNSSEELSNALNAMMEYAEEHFSFEANMMQETEYPGIEKHKEQHIEFLTKTSNFCIDVINDKPDTYTHVFNFLTSWLKVHLETEDKKLDLFLMQLVR